MYNEFQPKGLLRAFALFKYRGTQTLFSFQIIVPLLTLMVGDCWTLAKLDVMDNQNIFLFLVIFLCTRKQTLYLSPCSSFIKKIKKFKKLKKKKKIYIYIYMYII